jgi:hypothetical protein
VAKEIRNCARLFVAGKVSTCEDNRTRGRSMTFRKSARVSAAWVNEAEQNQSAAKARERSGFTPSFHALAGECTSSFCADCWERWQLAGEFLVLL